METAIASELEDVIPEAAEEMLDRNGLRPFDVETLSAFQFSEFFDDLFDFGADYFTRPFRALASLVGIFLLVALIDAVTPKEERQNGVQDFIGVSALVLTLYSPVMECVGHAVEAISECSLFLLSFIPVFSGVLAAAGRPLSSMAYDTFLFGAIQVISQISATVLTPLLCVYLALCIVSALQPDSGLGSAAETIRKAVVWAIGLLLTLFVALLSVQTLVSGSADTVASKTAKFFLGSLIPVFGTALSDVFGSVQSCVNLIRQTTGSFGVIVALCTFLPILLEIASTLAVVQISRIVGDLFGVKRLSGLLKSVSSMLSLLLGMVLCFAVLIILSTTIVMMISMGW